MTMKTVKIRRTKKLSRGRRESHLLAGKGRVPEAEKAAETGETERREEREN